MPTRPKRERKVPSRYGFDAAEEAEIEADAEAVRVKADVEAVRVKAEEEEEKPTKRRAVCVKTEAEAKPPKRQARGVKREPTPDSPASAAPAATSEVAAVAARPKIKMPDPHKQITATRAKSEYKVTEQDLAVLECRRAKNPHYRTGPEMRIYKEIDVYNVAIEKYGSEEGLLHALEKSRERGAKARATHQANLARAQAAEEEERRLQEERRQYLRQRCARSERAAADVAVHCSVRNALCHESASRTVCTALLSCLVFPMQADRYGPAPVCLQPPCVSGIHHGGPGAG